MVFVTHPEVVIDPAVPVPDWSLSERGLARMHTFCEHDFVQRLTKIYSSAEKKARDCGEVVAERLGMVNRIDDRLGENDRSATGYLPREEFIGVARQFFAHPDQSIRGWERAIDAQRRIVGAVRDIADHCRGETVAIMSHGGVATLLMCHLQQQPISLSLRPPVPEGGCYFALDPARFALVHGWLPVEEAVPPDRMHGQRPPPH